MAYLKLELSASAGMTSAVVSANLYICDTAGGWNHYGPPGTITIDGTTTQFSHSFDRYQAKQWIGSAQKTVSYGSAQNSISVSVSATYQTNVSFGTLRTSSSINVKIPYQIAQATRLMMNGREVPENTICTLGEDSITVEIEKKSSQLRYECTVVIGAQQLTYGNYTSTEGRETWTFTPELSYFGPILPHKAQAALAIGVRSYTPDDQLVGVSYKYVQLKIPDSIKPTLTKHTVIAMEKGLNGKILQNKTMAAFTWTFGTDNLYGAAINLIQLRTDGKKWDIWRADFENHFPPHLLSDDQGFWCSTPGRKTYTITVLDTRGRGSTYSGSYEVYPYRPPKLDAVTVDRCTDFGVIDATGTSAKVQYRGSISPVGGENEGTLTIKTTTGSTTLLRASITVAGESPEISSSETLSRIDADKGYTVTVTLTDAVGESATYTTELSKALSLIDFSPNGIGLGVTAQNGRVTFDETVLPTAGLHDYGSNSNGHYVRYGNGVQICWMDKMVNLSISNAYGPAFIGQYRWTFPKPFVGRPVVSPGTMRWGTGASWGASAFMGGGSENTSVSFYLFDFYQREYGETQVQAIAIGRWR
ncbi:MAG: DUF859 domain-containing protein [Peptoniphilaceae bacterium]|nr:DUF859 domain-containing protein [Peptoniphilaceae bacterium]